MNPDSRLTNAHTDIGADLPALARIAADLEDILGESVTGAQRELIRSAANRMGQAIAALALARDDLGGCLGDCGHRAGMTHCTLRQGHTGLHACGNVVWDEDTARQWDAHLSARMAR